MRVVIVFPVGLNKYYQWRYKVGQEICKNNKGLKELGVYNLFIPNATCNDGAYFRGLGDNYNQRTKEIKWTSYTTKQKKVFLKYDEDCDPYWNEYESLRSLYYEVFHKPKSYLKDVEFEAECLGELNLEKAECSVNDKYSVLVDDDWKHKGVKDVDLSSIVRYSELEAMLTPEFLLHTRPCSLTSKQSYNIVRQYIRDHIVSSRAEITSDYNFCFTVKKKIRVKPYTHTWEEKKTNGRSYARPRIHSKNVEHKSVQLFEMTSDSDRYKGYTVLPGFRGESLDDLAENIKLYLGELMSYINEPVAECEHCNGTGHIIKEIKETNEN